MKKLGFFALVRVITAMLLPQVSLAATVRTPIPPTFDKSSVQFIFTSPTGTNDFRPLGTCFTVDVTTLHKSTFFHRVWWIPVYSDITFKPELGTRNRYIVTAKHVLFDEKGKLRPNMYFRADTEGGRISYSPLSISLTNGTEKILLPDDTNVDLVVFRTRNATSNEVRQWQDTWAKLPKDVRPKVGAFDATLVLDEKQLKQYNISEGEQMFFVGLFTPFYGAKRNIPICRFGRLSMLPDEPIDFGDGNIKSLYLMETSAFGGNSGSPAFFSLSEGNHTKIIFAGVVVAYFPDYEPIGLKNVAAIAVSQGNTGIASIVPAHYLYDILYSKEEQEYREQFWKELRPAHGYK